MNLIPLPLPFFPFICPLLCCCHLAPSTPSAPSLSSHGLSEDTWGEELMLLFPWTALLTNSSLSPSQGLRALGSCIRMWVIMVETQVEDEACWWSGIWGYSQTCSHPRNVRVEWDGTWRYQATWRPLHICPENQHLWIPSMLCLAAQSITGSQTVHIFWGVFALLLPGIQGYKLTEELLHIVTSRLSYFKKSSL